MTRPVWRTQAVLEGLPTDPQREGPTSTRDSAARPVVYFPGLNGIRCIAALAVIVHHIEQGKAISGYPSLWQNPLVQGLGKGGVSLFFVLSGFLITYLLVVEREATGDISVRKFYLRRILRIWPLYFFVVLGSLLLLWRVVPTPEGFLEIASHGVPAGALVLFLLILPNVAHVAYPPVLGATQAWSIGVEEQFYLVWPLLLRRFTKRLLELFVAIIGVKLLYDLAIGDRSIAAGGAPYPWNRAAEFVADFGAEYLAMGALFALASYRRPVALLRLFHHPFALVFAITVIPPLLAFRGFPGHNVIEAAAFGVLVFNVACNPRSLVRLENAMMNTLGRISYGIYMYHTSVIALFLGAAGGATTLQSPIALNVYLYAGVVFCTIVVALVSYRYFESPFLRLKAQHSRVRTESHASLTSHNSRGPLMVPEPGLESPGRVPAALVANTPHFMDELPDRR